jgi:hypothetical protein
VTDTAADNDDIVVLGAVESDDSMSLTAGDDVTLGTASNVKSINNIVFVNVDFGSVDAAGGTAIFAGAISGNNAQQYPIFVQGNAQDDLFSIQKMPLSAIAIVAGGGTLDNTFILLTDAAERVNVFATIVDVVGQPLITYVGNEQLDIVTQGGDDKVFVQMPEPLHGILADIVRVNTGAGDDSLKINGTTLADVIRVAQYTTNPIYRFQVLDTECLQVFGFNNSDIIENSAPISALLDGGNGIDHITGGDSAAHYDVIFGGNDIDVLIGRAGGDFLYADHDYNFGAPVQTFANGDIVNGGQGSDVIIALGGDTIQRDPGDFQPDVIVGQGLALTINDFLFSQLLPPNANNVAINLQKGLSKKCAMPIV